MRGLPTPAQRQALFAAIEATVDGEISKDDVIAQLTATDWPPDAREDFWRVWCHSAGFSVLRSDLERVRAGRAREMQRGLFD